MKPEKSNKSKFLITKLLLPTTRFRQAGTHLTTLLFYLSILAFIIALKFTDTPLPFGWYQQFMPNLNGRQIVGITFTDSLKGYAITNEISDTSLILRTTNGGDNWFFSHFDTGVCSYYSVQFINQNTGFISGYIYNGSIFLIVKTTDAGASWFYINAPFDVVAIDMFVLNQDTIWLVDSGSLTGGVFYTSNGGASWQQQVNLFGSNPDRIYMFNARIGFIGRRASGSGFYRTSNGGQNWNFLSNSEGLADMYFADSLLGWKTGFGGFKKTTNGGFNWVTQTMPVGGNISGSGISRFSNINRDTIWGCGGYLFYPGQGPRVFLHRTTNTGGTWYLQIPDTSFQIPSLSFIDFTDKFNGWSYMVAPRGIHTNTGGDTTFYLPVKQISSTIPKEFKLHQNYPNPFNPVTKIKYETKSKGKSEKSKIEIIVYDVSGKQITELVNERQSPGTYEIGFDASVYSSGVYFYSLIIDGILIDTKKMILLR